jgi:ABC-type phosphate transport system substrate-binding protein
VPGIAATQSSSSSGSSNSLEHGVLLWEQLPAGQPLSWPAWTHQEQQQPYTVRCIV